MFNDDAWLPWTDGNIPTSNETYERADNLAVLCVVQIIFAILSVIMKCIGSFRGSDDSNKDKTSTMYVITALF